MTETITWAEALRRHTVPGELYRPLHDGWVQCYACGHACKIPPGRPGICQVRFNEAGTLQVPRGYVAALACDPIEKKPFFHALPGTEALSFGMLGCDLHCAYCFPGDTFVATDRGPMTLEAIFRAGSASPREDGARVATGVGIRAIAASGVARPIRAVFEHAYRGLLVVIQPRYLPSLSLTPDHRIYATLDPEQAPAPVAARDLTLQHFIAVPRRYALGATAAIDVAEILGTHRITHRVAWKYTAAQREMILRASRHGATSRDIGAILGMSGSYVRHLRRKLLSNPTATRSHAGPRIEADLVRFAKEHRPGIPRILQVNEKLARLLGYYCAEGSVVRCQTRPNSWNLSFSFSHQEELLAEEVQDLLASTFGIRSQIVRRDTTLAVCVGKSSAALLFESLCGTSAGAKHVPQAIFSASRDVIEEFLDAYVAGDGHRYPNGKVSVTTISPALARGVAWLALQLGCFPSIYEKKSEGMGMILGRRVACAPSQYGVVWYAGESIRRRLVQTEDHHLVPIRSIGLVEHDGLVYNMEVEEEHNYLAGFILVSNCQNWETSQAVRDPQAVAPPRPLSAEDIVARALREGVSTIASTYNEPLITAEWAVEVFRVAKQHGLRTAFISNGNGTPEVLEYLQPWVDLYKVDLKSFRDKSYRQLGGRIDRILDTIPRLVQMGFWVEIVTLVIPGFNDSDAELTDMARWLAAISPDIPWHVTAFHKDYKMTDPDDTPVATLVRGWEIGRREGLRYVYAGNRPGRTGDRENTHCPTCNRTLIQRFGFNVLRNDLRAGRCPGCHTSIPGVWS